MISTLMWKEYREQRALWLAIALLAVILAVVLAATLGPGNLLTAFQDDKVRSAILWVVVCLLLTHGVVCGALLLAGEKESHTLEFLDAQIGWRAPLWDTKLKAGVLLVAAQALFLAGLRLGLGQGSWLQIPALLIMGIDALAWGLVGGVLVGSVFPAVLMGVGFLGLSWTLAFMMWDLGQPVVLVLKLTGALIGLRYSWTHFCAPDLARRVVAHPPARRRRLLPASWLVFLWLCARQGRLQLGITLAGCVVLGLLLPQAPLYIWPIGTLLVGLACGLAVFGYEQSGGQEPFLAAQRLPAGGLWTVKTLFWLMAALVGATLIFCLGGIHQTLVDADNLDRLGRPMIERWLGNNLAKTINLPLFLGQWFIHGFVFALIFSMITPKLVVAAVLALGSSILVLGLWLPSLICGGLEVWQILPIPLVLLVLSRWLLWPWLCGRLTDFRPMAILVGTTVAATAWLAANLWYRTVEIPDIGDPFDLRAYQEELNELAKNEAPTLIRQAVREFSNHQALVNDKVGKPAKPIFDDLPPAPEGFSYQYFIFEILDRGWPKEDKEIARWLDLLFAGKWAGDLQTAVQLPPGLLLDPRKANEDLSELQELKYLYSVRAMQLQNSGQDERALEHLQLLLALSRHVRHQTYGENLFLAWQIQVQGLINLRRWLDKTGPHPRLLRLALEMLRQHEKDSPSFADNRKACYLGGLNKIQQPELKWDKKEQVLFDLALQAPWEQKRLARFARTMYSATFQEEIEGKKIAPAFLRQQYFAASQLSGISYGVFLCLAHPKTHLCELRAAQLQIALALYQVEHAQPAARLEDLVPRYLSEVPLDPFSGQPFNYRVSKGEEIEVDSSFEERLRLQANQGLIWTDSPRGNGHSRFYAVPVWPKNKR